MKRILLLISICTCVTINSFSQIAADFTAVDCNTNSHTLYTDLNNGKVVVLVWVMPCAACIGGAKAAYDAVQTFAVSHPGKVLYYLADDAGNTGCATLTAWASTNSIGPTNLAVFDNVGQPINENNYGGGGMPHIVVIGGTDHIIYFNEKDGVATGITNAINNALSPTALNEVANADNQLKIFPNPVKDNFSFAYFLHQTTDVAISIVDVLGAKVQSLFLPNQSWGEHNENIKIEQNLGSGIYFLKLSAGNSQQIVRFIVAN